MFEISRSWASRSKIPPYLLEFFLEIRETVLERSNFFFHISSSLLKERGIYKEEQPDVGWRMVDGVGFSVIRPPPSEPAQAG